MHKLKNQTASVFKLPTEQRRPTTKDFQPVHQQETKKETFSNLSFYQMKTIDIAAEFLKQRGWEFRPAKKIEGIFNPNGKYDAKNPAQDDFSIYENKTLEMYAGLISKAEASGKTWKY